MKAFLDHIQQCQTCRELPDTLDLCQEGYHTFLKWSHEAQLRNEVHGPETDPQRAVVALRYFAKGFEPGDVILPRLTALAVYEYVKALEEDLARLAKQACKHKEEPRCLSCGILCPLCPIPEGETKP